MVNVDSVALMKKYATEHANIVKSFCAAQKALARFAKKLDSEGVPAETIGQILGKGIIWTLLTAFSIELQGVEISADKADIIAKYAGYAFD